MRGFFMGIVPIFFFDNFIAMALLDFLTSPRNRVYVAAGNKSSSGYDLIRDREQTGGYTRKRWVKLGGATYTGVPADVYDAQQDDRIIIAYMKDSNEIIAHYNLRTNKGSNAGLQHFIFHTVPIIFIGLGLIYFFTERAAALAAYSYADWVVLAIIAACYVYAYFDWQVQVYGQKLVDEYKAKNKH